MSSDSAMPPEWHLRMWTAMLLDAEMARWQMGQDGIWTCAEMLRLGAGSGWAAAGGHGEKGRSGADDSDGGGGAGIGIAGQSGLNR